MAAGDLVWFSQAKLDLLLKRHDLSSDTIKVALVTNVLTPTETDAAPHFGGTGTTNFATNECAAGGNYTSGGLTLASKTAALVGANAKFDADDVSILKHASNPTNGRWWIGYNDTDANKRALFFVDLGAVIDHSLYDGGIRFDANGIIVLS